MSEITVSVVVPCLNAEAYLPDCISTWQSQTLTSFEVILVNDGSSDATGEIINSICERDPRFRQIDNGSNKGCYFSAQRGFELSRGRYLSFQTCKDSFHPDFLRRTCEVLDAHPAVGLSACVPGWINDGERSVQDVPWLKEQRVVSGWQFANMLNGGFIAGHSTVFRKNFIEAAGEFDPELAWHADWFSRLVLAFRHGIALISDALAFKVNKKDSYSTLGRTKWDEQTKVLAHILKLLQSEAYRDVLPHFITSNCCACIADQIIQACQENPSLFTSDAQLLVVPQIVDRWKKEAVDKGAMLKSLGQRTDPDAPVAVPQGTIAYCGFALLEAGKTAEASMLFNEALQSNPQSPILLLGIARTQLKRGDFAGALRLLASLQTTPHLPTECLFILGDLFCEANDFQRAQDCFASVLAQRQGDCAAIEKIAFVQIKRDAPFEALETLRQGIEINQTVENLWRAYGNLARALGKTSEADRALDHARNLSSLKNM